MTDSSGRASRGRVGRDRDRGTGPGWVYADGTRPSGQQGRKAWGHVDTGRREGASGGSVHMRGNIWGNYVARGGMGVCVPHSRATTSHRLVAHEDKQVHPFRPTHPEPHKPIGACQVPHRGPPTARSMQAGPRHQHTPDSVHGVAGLGRGASPAPALGDTGVAGLAGAWSSFTSSNSSYARQSSSVARCRFRAVTARGGGEHKPLAEAVSAPEAARADVGEG